MISGQTTHPFWGGLVYSTASQRDQGHITVARVAGKHRHVPGDGCRCRWPSVRNQPSLAGGRNPRRLARRPPQPCAPRVHADSGGGVEPTGQDSRLGHHTRDLPLTHTRGLSPPSSTLPSYNLDDSTETYASPQPDTTGSSRPHSQGGTGRRI